MHHAVRPLGNSDLIIELLRCSIDFCWPNCELPPYDSDLARGNPRQSAGFGPAKEAAMELRTRLNVLAAIISFAFLTAVVFGMF